MKRKISECVLLVLAAILLSVSDAQSEDDAVCKAVQNLFDQRINVQLDSRYQCTGVIYGSYCYKLAIKAMSTDQGGGKSWAASVCTYRGGTLVDIENEEMYNLLYTYVQDSWVVYVDRPTFPWAQVWLASRYENGSIRNSNGSQVYAKWHQGHPNSDPSDVVWQVGLTSNPYFGMYTTSSSYAYAVPLCKFAMT